VTGPLGGFTIGITADRRWQEQADLFTKRGATVLHGPTMRTVDLSQDAALQEITESLISRPPEYLIATTGMGMRLWLGAASSWGLAEALLETLAHARVIARGAKSASAVRSAGLDVWWQAPSERMDDIVSFVAESPASGARLALQLFDPNGHPSTAALAGLVGELVEVPVYRWLLPDDPSAARSLVTAAIERELAAVTFTSQPAVYQLFQLAGELAPQLRDALNSDVLPACVGPVCAEAATEEGISRPVWPEPPRLVALVKLVTERLSGAA
jgi:uroporphyrinogen-III synthase